MSETDTEVDLSEWSTIDVAGNSDDSSSSKVEFEIEKEEEVKVASKEEPQRQVRVEEEKLDNKQESDVDQPEELDGIKTKGAEKRIKQLIRQRKEREEEIEKLRSEVTNLRSSVQTRDKELSSSLRSNIDSTEGQITSRIEKAREIYKQAADSGDSERMLEAQEEMAKAYAESTVVDQQKRAWEDYNSRLEVVGQSPEQHVAPQQTPQYDPKAVEWASKNSWFGNDQIMTAAALAVDSELKSEGYDPSDDDFYEAIDNKLRSQFPHKYEDAPVVQQEATTPRLQDTPSNSAQVVAGASRTPQTSRSNRVKLTQEDVRRANQWGIPLEKFAAEKLKADNAQGEYTEIYDN
tara:strand:+ start:4444 stop:5490 length:1047 start_codon:yes stop_codon:yes gene_type:complete